MACGQQKCRSVESGALQCDDMDLKKVTQVMLRQIKSSGVCLALLTTKLSKAHRLMMRNQTML